MVNSSVVYLVSMWAVQMAGRWVLQTVAHLGSLRVPQMVDWKAVRWGVRLADSKGLRLVDSKEFHWADW